MQVEEELAELSPKKDMLLTIGVFDGVHLGHKYLISQLIEHARKQNLFSGVVTFCQHPEEVLLPQTKLPFLTDLVERASLLKNEGVEAIITLSFTPELAQLSAHQFVSLLKKYLRMRGVVIGPDFVLGRSREGSATLLRTLGQDMNFSVIVIPPITINGEVVSSTAISLELGFPTANLDIDSGQALPAEGVYATWAYIDDKAYQSMTNIGNCPTFGGNKCTVEVYILDYHSNLYGHELKIDIIERLRSEKQFDTVEKLKKQIAEDVKQGRAILNSE